MALTTLHSKAGTCCIALQLLLLLLLLLVMAVKQLLIKKPRKELCQLYRTSHLLLPVWSQYALLLQLLQSIPERGPPPHHA
jgi:hypothetical protein